jgi:hypothetical protein
MEQGSLQGRRVMRCFACGLRQSFRQNVTLTHHTAVHQLPLCYQGVCGGVNVSVGAVICAGTPPPLPHSFPSLPSTQHRICTNESPSRCTAKRIQWNCCVCASAVDDEVTLFTRCAWTPWDAPHNRAQTSNTPQVRSTKASALQPTRLMMGARKPSFLRCARELRERQRSFSPFFVSMFSSACIT